MNITQFSRNFQHRCSQIRKSAFWGTTLWFISRTSFGNSFAVLPNVSLPIGKIQHVDAPYQTAGIRKMFSVSRWLSRDINVCEKKEYDTLRKYCWFQNRNWKRSMTSNNFEIQGKLCFCSRLQRCADPEIVSPRHGVTVSVRGFWPKIHDASVGVRNTIHCIRCQVSIRVRHVHCPNLI